MTDAPRLTEAEIEALIVYLAKTKPVGVWKADRIAAALTELRELREQHKQLRYVLRDVRSANFRSMQDEIARLREREREAAEIIAAYIDRAVQLVRVMHDLTPCVHTSTCPATAFLAAQETT